MNKMFVFAIVALAAFLGAAPSNAKADYVYDWSFSNTIGNVAGTVSGTVSFSDISAGGHAASSLIITSVPQNLPLTGFSIPSDTSLWNTLLNNFTFDNSGNITDVSFYSQSTEPFGAQLLLGIYTNNLLSFNNNEDGVLNYDGFAGITFTPQATPEPASLALLAAGAPCMMLVRRLRRKAVVS